MRRRSVKNTLAGMILLFWIMLPMTGKIPANAGRTTACLPDLMPVPLTCIPKPGRFRFGDCLTVSLQGPENQRIRRAIDRFAHHLLSKTNLHTIVNGSSPNSGKALMAVSHRSRSKLVLGEEEAYTLNINPESIRLSADHDLGILRGLQTLVQLVQPEGNGFFLPCLAIEDRPRFPWRGLLIDSCRHFMPLDVIKRNLDGMAAVKMNVLHWHLTEDQGFRIECKTFPRLHELGSDGLYYTQEQVREIIAYAADRGIRVVPEFDIPGHSTSWLVGYPELASAPGPYQIERGFGIFDACFNPAKPETYIFFKKFFIEMAALFPDEYIHIGGDEVNGRHWDENPEIQEFMKKNKIPDNHSLQAHFNRRIAEIITDLGKKMIGWEQILQPGLPEGTIIESYLGEASLVNAARLGYPVINSKADELYIDLLYPTDFHYLYDPLPNNLPLDENQKKLVLGSEATMWSELVSPENIDSRIWPRTAAIAERLWSPGRVNDLDDLHRRLGNITLFLEELGLRHRTNRLAMLRCLSRGTDIQPLKTLVDTLKPIILYDRPDWKNRYTQLTPLNRVVDAALPDSPVSRNFSRDVTNYLRDRNCQAGTRVRQQLQIWKNNHRRLKSVIDQSPALKEIEELSGNLCRAAEIGLTALEAIDKNKKIETLWVKEKKNLLETMKQPRADMILVIIPTIEKLVEKAIQ